MLIASAMTIGIHMASFHSPGGYDEIDPRSRTVVRHQYRTVTPGIYASWPGGATLGVFSNSYGDPAAYAAWTWQTQDRRFALTAGAAVGYKGRSVLPMLVPSVRIGVNDKAALRFGVIPGKGTLHRATVLHVSMEYDL